MNPAILLSLIASVLLPLLVLCIIRICSLGKPRYVCTHCGYHFRVKWYKRPFVRRHGKDQATLTCPVCRTHGLFGREETIT